ncbi:MAG: DUF1573 domain-containing protein [Cytophagales bacterium]|nr:MAG: DUF1573 domain-containing protein [Cytophagales bacterium]TAF60973.1 MAG: DUF1573 domain-containing protein [Cytophagales bacterium]
MKQSKLIFLTLLFLLCLNTSLAWAQSERVGYLRIKKTELSFGEVKQGDKAKVIYECENTGNYPVIINQVRGSCGCVVGDYPREPIAPNEKAKIEIIFNTQGKQGAQKKIITIVSNAENSELKLILTGTVLGTK